MKREPNKFGPENLSEDTYIETPGGDKSEPQMIELPSDLQCTLNAVNTAGQYYDTISGTFDGKKISLRHSSWDGKKWNYYGTAADEKISQEEAQLLWEKIYPMVVIFDKIQRTHEVHLQQLSQEWSKERKQWKEKVDLAHEQGLVEGEKIGKIKGILSKRLEELKIEEGDREFLENAINQISQLDDTSVASNSALILMRYETATNDPQITEKMQKNDAYERRVQLLMELLGAKNSQKWVAGFGNEYISSHVYETTLPDTILRVCVDRGEIGSGVNQQIKVEKNSRFQKNNSDN